MIEEQGSAIGSDRLRSFLHRYAYSFVLVGSLLVLWWGYEGPFAIERVAIGVQISSIFIVLGLEVVVPLTRRWGTIKNVTRADVIYFLSAAPLDALQTLLLVGILAQTKAYHGYVAFFDVWPNEWPILLQLLLVTLLVDFFKYWYHRWTHTVPLLWRYHSIHHSLERLEMLRASYFFPLDIFLTVGTGTFVLLMFGVQSELIVFHNVWAGISGLLNHSNTDLNTSLYDPFMNSPAHHRAHHAKKLEISNTNFGSMFNFVDRLFGTRYLPTKEESMQPLGLMPGEYAMPTTWLQQLMVPFRWDRIQLRKSP